MQKLVAGEEVPDVEEEKEEEGAREKEKEDDVAKVNMTGAAALKNSPHPASCYKWLDPLTQAKATTNHDKNFR